MIKSAVLYKKWSILVYLALCLFLSSIIFQPYLASLLGDTSKFSFRNYQVFSEKSKKATAILSSTDPKHSIVEFDTKQTLRVGEEFTARVSSRSFQNEAKTAGGDFFQAVLYRSSTEGDGIEATVIDHMNGTYSIQAPLLWEGEATLSVLLIHSTEAIALLKLKTSEENGNGVGYISTSNGESVECGAFLGTRNHLCNFSSHGYNEPWYCVHPVRGCENVTSYKRDDKSWKTRRWKREYGQYFDEVKNWQVPIIESGRNVVIEKSDETLPHPSFPCDMVINTSREALVPSGYFLDGKWNSFECRNREFSVNQLKRCLSDSIVYILGDSTAKQLYKHLTRIVIQSEFRKNLRNLVTHCNTNNITIHFNSHGPPLQKPGSFDSKKYMSATMNSIRNVRGRRFLIIVSFGLHFITFKPSYFRQRVIVLRKSFRNLQARIPNIKLIVKSINFHHESNYAIPRWQWLCFRFNGILRDELSNIPNIVLIDTWGMTMIQTPQDVHVSSAMLNHQLNFLLSHVCRAEGSY